MCGIAGIVQTDGRGVSRDVLDRMVESLEHRGPDDSGTAVGEKWALGHRRLAILDLTRGGHQPMALGDLLLVYNGEVYNYLELRTELEALGHEFTSSTDTEGVLHAYQEWGEDCLEKFIGMWALALLDQRRQVLFCARDRLGVKPFYYAHDRERFLFASECPALLEAGISRSVDEDAVAAYLVTGLTDHDERTFYATVRQLPPAARACLDLRTGSFVVARYYDLAAALTGPSGSAAEYREALEESVRLRLRSDVPVGTCLSGGLDSSTVAALASREARRLEPHRFHAVTAGVGSGAPDETSFAREVVEHCELAWDTVTPTFEDFAGKLEACLVAQGEPVGGPSVFLQYCVMRRARKCGLKVMLDGQGGDESLLGYERYYPAVFGALLRRGQLLRAAREYVLACRHSKLTGRSLLAYTAYFSSLTLRRRHLHKRFPFLNSEVLRRGLVPLERFRGKLRQVEELQVLELQSSQLPHLLRYEDRNSMAHSIEARVPLVDHRVIEAALRLPLSEKIRDGFTKYALRQIAADLVPPSIAWRREKVGFEAPTAAWLERLEPGVSEAIAASPLLRRVLSAAPAFSGVSPKTGWALYNLAVWERQFGVTA